MDLGAILECDNVTFGEVGDFCAVDGAVTFVEYFPKIRDASKAKASITPEKSVSVNLASGFKEMRQEVS